MDKKLSDLLAKINFNKEKIYAFNDVKIEKIVVKEEKKTWNIILKSKTNLEYGIIKEFIDCLTNYVNKKYTYTVTVKADEENLDLFEDYYKNILILINNNNLYYDMFLNRLLKEEDYFIEVYNKNEESIINKKIDEINKYYKQFGFKKELKIKVNSEKRDLIKKEITKDVEVVTKVIKEKVKEKEQVVSNILLGKEVRGKITPLREIGYEIDNITCEVMVFGVVLPTKKGVYSITLKTTDLDTSIYVRIYVNSEEQYDLLVKKLKPNMWLKVNGYIKNNTFYNDFVLNARNIEVLEKELKTVTDGATNKRVELHAHTMMSQMDGVIEVKNLIKKAKELGHKAIAITDHNSIQTFPEAYHHKEEIKILYGVELAMIDDDLDLVVRPNDSLLKDNTYVIFDFETTGFNAGGGDSIIEIGAVMMKNGEVIDRFSRLINPFCKLNEHIVELTHITDEMLKDKRSEEEEIKDFIAFFKDYPMVAHNAKFDVSFLEMAYQKYNLGVFNNPVLDTLQLSRAIEPNVFKHSLSALVKRYDVEFDENAHHRADYDAEATGKIFFKMLDTLDARKIEKMSQIDSLISKDEIHKFGNLYHINVLVKNQIGLKNLFKLVSYANTKYLFKTPRVLRSVVQELREGLLISSGCSNGEIFQLAKSKSDDEISDLMNFYDYIEVQPPEVYSYMVDLEDFRTLDEVKDNIKKIVNIAKSKNKLIVASGDVHHLEKDDKIYREIIVNQKVPGGGRHPLSRDKINSIPSQHFRTTDEMLADFEFLGKDLAYEIVVSNTNEVADMIEDVVIIPDTKGIPFSPIFENSKQIIRDLCYNKAHEIYGNDLPKIIEERLEAELNGIINGGFDSIYLIAQKLVKHSNDDGYYVGSRGSVGSSFAATMLGITEVNPLPAHYVCPKCKKTLFEDEKGLSYGKDYPSGYDLPDKICECGTKFKKEGQDMPFATFLGFNADKVPDIDLNFSGDYQAKAHDYTKVLFGSDYVYRAGTIGTVADKTAFGFVKGYFEDRGIENVKSLEIERLAMGVTGVKRTTGQHPGGIVVVPDYKEIFDFTPFQYPADDNKADWYTTHFNYHDIEDCLLKLDILGHDNPTIFKMLEDLTGISMADVPMDDKDVMSLFTSPKILGVTEAQINCEVGALGLPEFTRFVMGIVNETKPTTFAELVKISGLSHGTDVWNGNAQELVKNNICPFREVIGCRDDIMVYLINNGLKAIDAFKIMEFVRKGKASKDKEKWAEYKALLKENKIADWYIDSCEKIKYMFPKAHATAYISAAWKIAWFKINKPIEFYATWFSIKGLSFDLETLEMGYEKIKEKLDELQVRKFGLTPKESDIVNVFEVALEMTARGFKFGGIDLNKSDAKNFIIDDDRITLIPPFRALDGMGEAASNSIITERENKEFISIEDLQKRAKLSSTNIEKMRILGVLKNLPESSQLSLF